jgi:hypothetical protein
LVLPLEFGTRPHTIKPTEKQALYFDGGFANEVHNPGIRPRLIYRSIRDAWMASVMKLPFVEGLAAYDYDEAEIAAMTRNALENAKELMAKRLETEAPGSRPGGKLKGRTAAEVWREQADVVEIS